MTLLQQVVEYHISQICSSFERLIYGETSSDRMCGVIVDTMSLLIEFLLENHLATPNTKLLRRLFLTNTQDLFQQNIPCYPLLHTEFSSSHTYEQETILSTLSLLFSFHERFPLPHSSFLPTLIYL